MCVGEHVSKGGNSMWLLAIAVIVYVLSGSLIATLIYLLIFTPELMLLWVIIEYIRQLIGSDR